MSAPKTGWETSRAGGKPRSPSPTGRISRFPPRLVGEGRGEGLQPPGHSGPPIGGTRNPGAQGHGRFEFDLWVPGSRKSAPRNDVIVHSLAKPVARKLRRDIRVERFRRREIGAAAFGIVVGPQAGDAAAVERARLARIAGQCRIVIGNRLLEPAELEIR